MHPLGLRTGKALLDEDQICTVSKEPRQGDVRVAVNLKLWAICVRQLGDWLSYHERIGSRNNGRIVVLPPPYSESHIRERIWLTIRNE